MKLKKFNEIHLQGGNYENGDAHSYTQTNNMMKKYALTTTSESSDHYIYFIEHTDMPTSEELQKFLIENGSDVYPH